MDGWIKLDRSVLESKIFANPIDFKIWAWLMLKASTADRFILLKIGKGNTTVEIKRGQLVFGRHKAEADLKIDGSTIYRVLQRFQEEQIISIKANNQFSVITVNSFIESQSFEETENFEIEEIEQPKNNQRTSNEQPMSNQRSANEQPTNTVEESKEGKELEESQKSSESKETPAPGNLFGDPEPVNGKKSKKAKSAAAPKIVCLPWDTAEFSTAWDNWKRFKAGQFKFQYKTAESEQAALMDLSEISGGSEIDAIKIINQSMAKGWKGLFALKNSENENGSNQKGINGTSSGKFSDDRTAAERYAAIDKKYSGWENN